MTPAVPTFLIVTPTYNSARFLDETIHSVTSQQGAFRIHYHVQDGGSSDETLDKVTAWASRVSSGAFTPLCAGVGFSYDSERDAGMYDAINRGFERLAPGGSEYMTYINSDDRLQPGALQFAATVFAASPEIQWVGGRPCEMNEQGELMRIHEEQVYPAATLRAGLHDGRHLSYVMQEGTFWRADLWRKAGGFDTNLRQAGDWDLWRRFAAAAEYVTTDVILAGHRRRAAQLTADMGTYHGEVDRVVQTELGDARQAEWSQFQEWERAGDENDRRYFGKILRFQVDAAHGGSGHWQVEERACRAILRPTVAVTNGFTHRMIAASFEAGFGPPSGAELRVNLLPGFRVTNGPVCSVRFEAEREGLHRLFLRCRVVQTGVKLTITGPARPILNVDLPYTGHERDCLVIAEAAFTAGDNVVTLAISGVDAQSIPVLVILSLEAMSTI